MRPHRELTEQFVYDVYEIIHPTTNAELMRGLTDEKLASYLVKIGCDMQCTKHCLEWLKQPQEGENYARDFI